MMEWIKDFFTKDTINGIIATVLAEMIIALIFFLPRIIKFIKNWIRKTLPKAKNHLKKTKENLKYKRTIKRIERLEIPLPEDFLVWKSLDSGNVLIWKSPERNPELKNIFRMIDEGSIQAPLYKKAQEDLKKKSESMYKIWDKLKDKDIHKILAEHKPPYSKF